MTDDVCACGGQMSEVMSNNRVLYTKTSQELADTNKEATYRKITYITNARALLVGDGGEKITSLSSSAILSSILPVVFWKRLHECRNLALDLLL